MFKKFDSWVLGLATRLVYETGKTNVFFAKIAAGATFAVCVLDNAIRVSWAGAFDQLLTLMAGVCLFLLFLLGVLEWLCGKLSPPESVHIDVGVETRIMIWGLLLVSVYFATLAVFYPPEGLKVEYTWELVAFVAIALGIGALTYFVAVPPQPPKPRRQKVSSGALAPVRAN